MEDLKTANLRLVLFCVNQSEASITWYSRDIWSNGWDWSAADNSDVPLLETVVGAADTKQEQRQEDDGADDEKNLKFSQWLQRYNRSFWQP